MTVRLRLQDGDIRAMLVARAQRAAFPGLLADVIREVQTNPMRRSSIVPRSLVAPFAATLAAGIVIALVALVALVRAPQVGPPPSPTPSHAASPAATATAMLGVGLDGAPMPAGRYHTVFFQPPFEFDVLANRWIGAQDIPRQLLLRAAPPQGQSGVDALTIVHLENVYVDPCAKGIDGGTQPWSGDATAFFDWLATNAPVSFGTPQPTTQFGLPAVRLEVAQPDLSSSCSLGYMPITDVGRPFTTGLPGQPTRYVAVDVGGQTLLVTIWATDPARWDEVRSAADEVLDTVEFSN